MRLAYLVMVGITVAALLIVMARETGRLQPSGVTAGPAAGPPVG
jgi:hypothetical protein